eukprot:5870407-Amphidinium_carterae.2
MESEEHLIAATTAGVVRCRTVRRRPAEDQYDLLAMQGTPWDAKSRLATHAPMIRGLQAVAGATTATAASSGGAGGSTDRVKKVDESLPVEVPDDVPEEGEPDVEGALPRPEKRAWGRPRKQTEHFDRSSFCTEFAARVGLTQEQVQMAQDKGLLPELSETTGGSVPTAAASGAAGSQHQQQHRQLVERRAHTAGTASGSVPGVTNSTVRKAETLAEEHQEALKFVRLADEETISTLWGSTRLSKIGEITDVAVTVPMERNELDYSNIDPERYYTLVDEDNGQQLESTVRCPEGGRRCSSREEIP